MIDSGIPISILVFYVLQIVLLPYQVISSISRYSDKTRLRFLVLLIGFTLMNTVWILSNGNQIFDLIDRNDLLGFSGIILSTLLYRYFSKELNFRTKKLGYHKLFILLISIFVSTQVAKGIGDSVLFYTEWIAFVFYQLIAFYYCIEFILFLTKSGLSRNMMFYSAFISFTVLSICPIYMRIVTLDTAQNFYVNALFLIVSFTFFKYHFLQARNENLLLSKVGVSVSDLLTESLDNSAFALSDAHLTTREYEIALLMIQGVSYREIAHDTHISEGTVRKHASTIFGKVNVSNLNEFRKKYPNNSKKH